MQHKLKPEFKAAWLAALRSGEYEQTTDSLRRPEGFCCLGVACDVAMKMGLVEGKWVEIKNEMESRAIYQFVLTNGERAEAYPPADMCNVIFQNPIYDSNNCIGAWYLHGTPYRGLTVLNDNGQPFSHIADIIEEVF